MLNISENREPLSNNFVYGIVLIFSNRDRSIEESLIPEPIVLCIIPWFHTFGCHVLIGSVTYNSKCVYLPKFEERAFLGSIQVISSKYYIFKIHTDIFVVNDTEIQSKHNVSSSTADGVSGKEFDC